MPPTSRRSRTTAYCFVTAALILLTLGLVSRAAVDDRAGLDTNGSSVLQPDLFWPAALYQDLVQDGYSLRTFQFSAVTFWFPDVALFFAIRAVVASPPQAILLWAALLYLLLVGSAMVLVRSFSAGPGRTFALATVASIGASLLGYNACQAFQDATVRDLLLPLYRPGSVFNLFLALALTAAVVRGRPGRLAPGGPTLGLAALAALAVFSDRMFAVWFVAPAIATLGLFRLLFGPAAGSDFPLAWPRVAAAAAALVGGTVVGQLGIKYFPTDTLDPLATYYTGLLWNGAWGRLGLLARDVGGELESRNPLVLSAAAWVPLAIALLVAAFRSRREFVAADRARAFLSLFSLLCGAASVAAFVLSHTAAELLGRRPWPEYSRYLLGPIALALFGWAVLVGRSVQTVSRPWLRRAVLAAPLIAVAAADVGLLCSIGRPTADLTDIYPAYVADLDRVCRERNLRHGLAVYFYAKKTTLMSRAGVTLNRVHPYKYGEFGFLSYTWLSNAARYWQGPAGDPTRFRPQFILVPQTPSGEEGDIQLTDVVDRFGEPAERVPIRENLMVLVYDRPSDARFQDFAAYDWEVLNVRFRANRPHRLFYPGAAFHYPREDSRPLGFPNRTGEKGVTSPGLIATGPHLTPPVSGRYRATFRTSAESSEGPTGWVAVVVNYPADGRRVTAAIVEVPAGDRRATALDFAVDRGMRNKVKLEFLTHYHGHGRLTLHGVDLEVLPP